MRQPKTPRPQSRKRGPDNHDQKRRDVLKKAADWALGAVIGDITVKTGVRTAEITSRAFDDEATTLLEGMIGSLITVPVWNGDKMLQVECDFDHKLSSGYVLTGKRIVGVYKDGEECARLGEDMVKLGLLFAKKRRLRMKVNFEEIKKRLG